MKKYLLLLLLGLSRLAFSQGNLPNTITIVASGAPSGACGSTFLYTNSATGNLYNCKAGAWNLIGGAGTGVTTTGTPASGNLAAFTGSTTVSNTNLTGDCTTTNTVAVTCTQLNGANFTVNTSGVPTKIGGLTTAGQGAPVIVGVTAPKTETGADATLLSVTPAAAAGTYEACVTLDVSAANTATLGWTMTWKNSKGNANAPTNMSLFQMGVAAPALTFSAAANNSYYSCVPISVDNSGTAIVVKTTFSGTSIAYNAAATITRIQ